MPFASSTRTATATWNLRNLKKCKTLFSRKRASARRWASRCTTKVGGGRASIVNIDTFYSHTALKLTINSFTTGVSSAVSRYFFGADLKQRLTIDNFIDFQRSLQSELLNLEVFLLLTAEEEVMGHCSLLLFSPLLSLTSFTV